MCNTGRDPLLISILIPVFNEERNVRLAYNAIVAVFDAMPKRYRLEILFTDNHSTDGTYGELKALAAEDKRVKVLRFARNFGFQRSVLTAYRNATGDAAIQIDCDLQDPPELIPLFLEKWEAGFDVVVGIRNRRPENPLLHLGRRLFYRLVAAISDDNLIENAGDFRLVDRSVLDRLALVNDTQPYTRGLVSSLAARQTGISYDRRARLFERSKFPVLRLAGFATDGIVSHSLLPLRLAMVAGLAVSMVAFGLSIYYIVASLIIGRGWPAGFTTITVLLLFSMGINGVFLGILGEYVGRIFDQVRVRPLIIIDSAINFELPANAARLPAVPAERSLSQVPGPSTDASDKSPASIATASDEIVAASSDAETEGCAP